MTDHSLTADLESDDLIGRAIGATIASCNCETKTPELQYHAPECRFRVLRELTNQVISLRGALREWQKNCTGKHGSQQQCGLTREEIDILQQVLK